MMSTNEKQSRKEKTNKTKYLVSPNPRLTLTPPNNRKNHIVNRNRLKTMQRRNHTPQSW